MLVQRVITALILLPLLLAAVWYAPTPWLYGLFSTVGLWMAWEWTALMGLADRGRRLGYVALTGSLLAVTWVLRQYWLWFAIGASLWWAAAIWLLIGFPDNFSQRKPSKLQMGLLGQVLMLPTLLALAVLHEMPDGSLRLLYLLFLVFAADTGAYLAGRNLGRVKLAPNVSPGKTVEGAAGGLLLCALWALSAGTYTFAANSGAEVAKVVILSLAVAAISIVGDLTESMFKRLSGAKDSGTLLPGHGGLLDRVDSLLAAAPVMVLGVHYLRL